MLYGKRNLFIDAEWYISQNIFLIGYAYDSPKVEFGQLFGKQLTRYHFKKLLKKVKGFVFAYGPDIGMTEKFFRYKFRHLHKCINLLKVFRDHIKIGVFKLSVLEEKFRLKRKVSKYKRSIFHIWRDWKNPHKRYAVLTYNEEDVVNLVKLTRIIFRKYNISKSYLKTVQLA